MRRELWFVEEDGEGSWGFRFYSTMTKAMAMEVPSTTAEMKAMSLGSREIRGEGVGEEEIKRERMGEI